MKKTIFSLALASILCLGTTSAFAQTTDASQQDTAKKECCKKNGKKCDKKCDKAEGKKCDKKSGKKCDMKGRKAVNPFEGLNLTEAQQTALAAIPTPRQVMKAAKEQNKEAAKQGDKTSRQERMAVVRNIYSDYLNQVKAVLTPEQYTQFLENSYIRSSMMDGKKGPKMDGRSNGRKGHGKDAMKERKGAMKDRKAQGKGADKAQRPAAQN